MSEKDMSLKDFIICLKKADFETPCTIEFDKMYGQKEKRWWDELEKRENHSSQRHHIIGHFLCWYYQGAPSKCEKKYSECVACYSEKLKSLDLTDEAGNSEKPVCHIYNMMQKPEMFIYIAEVLGIFGEKELKNFVDEIIKSKDTSLKDVINSRMPWDVVEKKADEILKQK